MKKIIRTAGLLLLGGIAAYSSTYTFEISPAENIAPTDTASVTGLLTLPDGDGTRAATSLTFTGMPADMQLDGDAVGWANVLANTWTVQNGLITGFTFFALNPVGNGNVQGICFNNQWTTGLNPHPTNVTSGGFQCPGYLASAFDYNLVTLNHWVENEVSAFGVPLHVGPLGGGTASAPEPSAWSLVGIGWAMWAIGRLWRWPTATEPKPNITL